MPLPPQSRRQLIQTSLVAATAVCLPGAARSATQSRGTPLQFPRDAGAHPDFQTEWWYATGFANAAGQAAALGFQITFFRRRVASTQALESALAAKQLLFAHAAVSDVAGKTLWSDQRIGRWSGKPEGATSSITRLIESSLKIIAVDRGKANTMSDGSIKSRSVTVAASPEQVGRLAQAQATGSLVMSLVGIGDQSQNAPVEIDNNELLGIVPGQPLPVAAETAAPKICTIRSRKGTDVVDIPIPCAK